MASLKDVTLTKEASNTPRSGNVKGRISGGIAQRKKKAEDELIEAAALEVFVLKLNEEQAAVEPKSRLIEDLIEENAVLFPWPRQHLVAHSRIPTGVHCLDGGEATKTESDGTATRARGNSCPRTRVDIGLTAVLVCALMVDSILQAEYCGGLWRLVERAPDGVVMDVVLPSNARRYTMGRIRCDSLCVVACAAGNLC